MGIAVADVAGNKRTPVAGVSVTIKSNEGNGKIEGKTDDKGVLLVDLSKLTKPTKNANGVEVYALEASVSVEKEGYRSYETGWMSLKGGAGFDVPTFKLGDELVYPKRVTLSDWDRVIRLRRRERIRVRRRHERGRLRRRVRRAL